MKHFTPVCPHHILIIFPVPIKWLLNKQHTQLLVNYIYIYTYTYIQSIYVFRYAYIYIHIIYIFILYIPLAIYPNGFSHALVQ